MSETGFRCRNMQYLSTAFLIIALAIVVNQGTGAAARAESEPKHDQIAEETRHSALTITDGPKYVEKPSTARNQTTEARPSVEAQSHNHKPEQRPPSKPPINLDKVQQRPQKHYIEIPRTYYGSLQKAPARQHFSQSPLLYHPQNSLYNNYQQVIPLTPHKNPYYIKKHQQPQSRPLAFASSVNKPTIAKNPNFNLPVQTITGVRTESVRPPQNAHKTNVSTTTIATTTTRLLRTKRIWPKKILEKMNATLQNSTKSKNNDTQVINNSISDSDPDTAETVYKVKYVYRNTNTTETPKRAYRPVTRIPKIKSTTPSFNVSEFQPNDWIPLVPSHYVRSGRPALKRITKRSAVFPEIPEQYPEPTVPSKRTLYLHSFGLIPMNNLQTPIPEIARKKMSFLRKRKRQLNPYYSGYSSKPGIGAPQHIYLDDQQSEASHSHSHGHSHNNHQHDHRPRVVTRVKHHHHHHHHRYIKTVEKPVKVPYKVEVPRPYPVPVERRVPVPVEKIKVVEKPVPYPIGIKVPHPVPVKVVEKEYVPKPYAVIQHVPVVKHVEVKVPHPVPVRVEKRVPYPVEVKVPVDRPVPVPVTVEKQVPYPVPVKVLVPQPYPVETKVPYPVQVKVKEPVEVVKHVPVRVPVPQPFAVKVPHPVPVHVEKKVPYPVEVEKKVPVPFKVLVPQKVEVEKRVPVYIPKPYPVEKKIPVPIRVPYPVRVPVNVPYNNPYDGSSYHNPGPIYGDGYYVSGGISVSEESATEDPQHTVTVHGNTGFTGFQSRSDATDPATTTSSSSTSSP